MAIDIMQAIISAPPPIDFVMPGLVAGTIGALVSPGGTGKSIFALEVAIAIAGGPDLLGLGIGGGGGQRVWYLPAEDPPIVLQHRIHALGAYMDEDERASVAVNLIIEPLIGRGPDLTRQDWSDFLKGIGGGTRMIVMDTFRRFHACDENDSGAMARLLTILERVAQETGTTILFLHHTSKAAALGGQGDQQQASRGSSVLTDNVRWQAYLTGMGKGEAESLADPDWGSRPIGERRGHYVKFGVSKTNYGPPIQERWLVRRDGGVLLPVALSDAVKGGNNNGNGGGHGRGQA